jgi:hypothetical protein
MNELIRLTVPANNRCSECAPDHVDLTEKAFDYLEPGGGTVGIAKNATITYTRGCDGVTTPVVTTTAASTG